MNQIHSRNKPPQINKNNSFFQNDLSESEDEENDTDTNSDIFLSCDEPCCEFTVNKELLNSTEIEANMQMEPQFLKNYIDSWLNSTFDKWDNRLNTENFKLWTRWQGSEFEPNIPMIRSEMLFPDIHDPTLIRLAMVQDRVLWDKSK